MGQGSKRNLPCECGSGNKYKHCCGAATASQKRAPVYRALAFDKLSDDAKSAIKAQLQKERELVAKYGHGRPIISTTHKGQRLVAVGCRLCGSTSWKTFHDFLFDYVANVVGGEWGNAEIQKPKQDRHTIMQLYDDVCTFQRKHIEVPGQISSAAASGSVMAYLSLAYDLYTLEHNCELPDRLLARLKDPVQYQGARYELFVAAALIRAGFKIVFEDENDGSTTHCEYTANCRSSGRQYSVEAKSRHRDGLLGRPGDPPRWGEVRLRIVRLLREALKKAAAHRRVVFLDVNMPPEQADTFETSWFPDLASTLEKREKVPIDEQPCPPAYVVATNHPYHYVGNDAAEPGRNFVMTGINQPWMKVSEGETKEQATKRMEEKDPPIMRLYDSLLRHTAVPDEFN